MRPKPLVFKGWDSAIQYINGDLVVDCLKPRTQRVLVFWGGAFHDSGLVPTKTNVAAMVKLFASMKGKP